MRASRLRRTLIAGSWIRWDGRRQRRPGRNASAPSYARASGGGPSREPLAVCARRAHSPRQHGGNHRSQQSPEEQPGRRAAPGHQLQGRDQAGRPDQRADGVDQRRAPTHEDRQHESRGGEDPGGREHGAIDQRHQHVRDRRARPIPSSPLGGPRPVRAAGCGAQAPPTPRSRGIRCRPAAPGPRRPGSVRRAPDRPGRGRSGRGSVRRREAESPPGRSPGPGAGRPGRATTAATPGSPAPIRAQSRTRASCSAYAGRGRPRASTPGTRPPERSERERR